LDGCNISIQALEHELSDTLLKAFSKVANFSANRTTPLDMVQIVHRQRHKKLRARTTCDLPVNSQFFIKCSGPSHILSKQSSSIERIAWIKNIHQKDIQLHDASSHILLSFPDYDGRMPK
jgi:hypothetical protein